jgi:hypothetical protein
MQNEKRNWKAYSSLAGGFVYFLYAGSYYTTSQIAPYVASYYGVNVEITQYLIPT